MKRTSAVVLGVALLANAASAEFMCGPTKSIPCSLFGCGAPNEQGMSGQSPCRNYYPRTCDITFQSRRSNYTEAVIERNIKKLVLPSMSSFISGMSSEPIALHDANEEPLVSVASGEVLTGCTISKVEYVSCKQNLEYRNVVCESHALYPDLNAYTKAPLDNAVARSLSLQSQFTTTNDGKTLAMTPVAAGQAWSLYNALSGTATVLTMSCGTQNSGNRVDSCLLFEAEPTNESPALTEQTDKSLKVAYVFDDPPVMSLTLANITDGTNKSADVLINPGNPLVTVLDVAPTYCNGEIMEVQSEDGKWHSFFLGTDGHYIDMNHIVYINARDVYSSTMQVVWASLYGFVTARNLRVQTTCYDVNGYSLGKGYLYFGTTYAPWSGEVITCENKNAPAAFCGPAVEEDGGPRKGSIRASTSKSSSAALRGSVAAAVASAVATFLLTAA